MEPLVVAVLAVLSLLFLLAIGVHIAFALFAVGLVGLCLLKTPAIALNLLGSMPYSSTGVFGFAVIPLFIIMGAFAVSSGLASKAYSAAYTIMGRATAGLALASVAACSIFAAATGSSAATAATIGAVAIPEMEKRGYNPAFACGAVAAGGTLGILIPPSVILVIYGIVTGESIGKLLIAGFVPGVLLTLSYMAVILIIARIKPQFAPRGPATSAKQKAKSLAGLWGFGILIFVVLGGLYSGWATATEVAALGAFAALVMGIPTYRRAPRELLKALQETAKTTSMIFIIIAGASFFTLLLAAANVPSYLTEQITRWDVPREVIIAALCILFIVMGMFLDPASIMLIAVPLAYPVVTALGYNGIWFGIVVVILLETSYLSPPVGFNVFVIHGIVPHVPSEQIFKHSLPYVISCVAMIALLMVIPQLVTFVPSLMK